MNLKSNNIYRRQCFDLYGFDILLDSNLRPWLLEINASPSLACNALLDKRLKSMLMCDTFNLIGIIPYDKSDHNIQSRIANQCDKNIALSDEIMLIEFEEELSRLIKKEVDILKEFFL